MVGTRYLVLLLIGLAGASYMLSLERRRHQGPRVPPVEANVPQSDRCQPFIKEEKEKLLNGFEKPLHPRLLELIRCEWLHPPSARTLTLRHPERKDFSQANQSQLLDDLMGKRTGGFYVECGAHDGEHISNTLFFERQRNWTGLLIEANTGYFGHLLKKNRNAYSINACLNTESKTAKRVFNMSPVVGGVVSEMFSDHRKWVNPKLDKTEVQCFPLYSILKALGRTHIDLLSLDVEGAELGVLGTIPFSELVIEVLLVEYAVLGSKTAAPGRFKQISRLMKKTGLYELYGTTRFDMIFVRKNAKIK